MAKRSRTASPVPKDKGLTSVNKSVATGAGMSTEKKRKPSPLPVQIDIVENNFSSVPMLAPSSMGLADLLCVSQPRRRIDWRAAFIQDSRREAAGHAKVGLSAASRRKFVGSSLQCSTLTEDAGLGKRHPRVTMEDIEEGLTNDLISWHDLCFNKQVVGRLLQSLARDSIKQEF